MRNVAVILCCCILLSCGHGGNNSQVAKQGVDTLDVKKIFTGNWVDEKYVRAVNSDMAISKAQDLGILVIFDKDDKSLGYANSYFHAGPGPFGIEKSTNGYRFHNDVFNNGDSVSDVQIVNSSRIIIGKEPYIKLHDTNYRGEPNILEEYLFVGRYRMSNGKEVVFNSDGTVTGLDTCTWYLAEPDYIAGPDPSINYMGLGQSCSLEDNVAFYFHKDTLNICTINKDPRDTNDYPSDFKRSYGKVLYKMWREKH